MTCCNIHSKVVNSFQNGAAAAMLRATGVDATMSASPFIGIGAAWFNGNPCNMHLRGLADDVEANLNRDRPMSSPVMVPRSFGTIGVSDGISMGTSGMRYSLPSRELIADSVETMVCAHHYDASILIPGCDKNMPGMCLGALRSDRPAIIIYGGTIRPGISSETGEALDVVSAFQASGAAHAGNLTPERLELIVNEAIPGAGACGGMYTANSMAVVLEVMGLTPFNSSSNPATSQDKIEECHKAGSLIRFALENDIRPKDLVTKKSIRNAIRVCNIMGASTNIVLHLLAIAKEAKIDLNYNDFIEIAKETPLLADMKPSGRYLMNDLYSLGGTQSILKALECEGLIDGDTMTIEGMTLKERFKNHTSIREIHDQDLLRTLSSPIKSSGHIRILTGNLAPGGAVSKISGKEGTSFTGPACVFDSEEAMLNSLNEGKIESGRVIVIRNCGPVGGPGMPEMLKPTSAIAASDLAGHVALITDGRFSGGSHGFIVGHIEPEAAVGGPISKIRDGDVIEIHSEKGTIQVIGPSAHNFVDRGCHTTINGNNELPTFLRKYRSLAKPASEGAIMG